MRQLTATPAVRVRTYLPGARPRLAGSMMAALILLAVAGCSYIPNVHVPPVQQGNAVDQEALSRLKPGMTRSQVRFVLGTPLIVDPFRQDRWDYVFMLKRVNEPVQQRRITVVFEGDALARIEGDVVGATAPAASVPKGAAADGRAAPKAQPQDSAPAAAEARPDARSDPKSDAKADPKAAAKGEAAAPAERGFFGRMFQRIGF